MDCLKLNDRAVDQLQPLINDIGMLVLLFCRIFVIPIFGVVPFSSTMCVLFYRLDALLTEYHCWNLSHRICSESYKKDKGDSWQRRDGIRWHFHPDALDGEVGEFEGKRWIDRRWSKTTYIWFRKKLWCISFVFGKLSSARTKSSSTIRSALKFWFPCLDALSFFPYSSMCPNANQLLLINNYD